MRTCAQPDARHILVEHFLKWIENESIAQCAYHEPSPAKTAPPLGMVLAEEPEEPLPGAP